MLHSTVSNAFSIGGRLAQATADGADASSAPSRSLLDYVLAGREIGLAIIVLSLVALALIVSNVIRIRSDRFAPAGTISELERLLEADETEAAIEFCNNEENDTFVTRVFGSALERCRRSPFGFLELKSSLEEAGQEQVSRLYRSSDWIGLIASVAPMLGLLGTVVGILIAFDTISQTEGVPRPGELAGGISQALVTTVMGLLVAIPCTFAFTWLRNRIDHLSAEAATVCERLASHVEPQAGGGANR